MTATPEIDTYLHTLSLHDALSISEERDALLVEGFVLLPAGDGIEQEGLVEPAEVGLGEVGAEALLDLADLRRQRQALVLAQQVPVFPEGVDARSPVGREPRAGADGAMFRLGQACRERDRKSVV